MKCRFEEGLVSVIIPTHNRAEMLRRAVTSVQRQDYRKLEIIIVADNCTDDTRDVVASFDDFRIIYLPIVKSVGGAQARNFGLDVAKGEYIAFLDDDDEWYEHKLSSQVHLLDASPGAAMVSCNFNLYDGETDKPLAFPQVVTLNDLLYENACGSFSFCMTKRQFVQDLKINADLKSHQDWDLWIKILQTTEMTCCVVQEPLVRYYHNHENKLSKKFGQSFLANVVFLRNHWAAMQPEHRNYQLYELMKRKRLHFGASNSHLFKLRMYCKALRFYRRSGHDQKLYNYLLLLSKILPLNR